MFNPEMNAAEEIGVSLFGQQIEVSDQAAEEHVAEQDGLATEDSIGTVADELQQDSAKVLGEVDQDTLQADAISAKAKKSDISIKVLASVKGAVKLYETLLTHDDTDAQLRAEIRDLIEAQKQAMELKLRSEVPAEGEDFDSITKRLRRANNKLDSHLDNKQGLSKKVDQAVSEALETLKTLASSIKDIEEAAG